MKNLMNFTQYNEAIYSIDWKEEFDEVKCETFNLEPGDKFEIKIGTPKYIEEKTPTKKVYYKGKRNELIYFSYTKNGIIYKIPIEELEEKIVNLKMINNFKEFSEGKDNQNLQDDITALVKDGDEYVKTNEPLELVQVTGILTDEEEIKKIEEHFVVHAGDFSGKEIKRGEIVWLSCLMKKPGNSYTSNQQGVLKCRITDIYIGLSKLNQLMK